MKLSRRKFFKTTFFGLAATTFMAKTGGLFNQALAVVLDGKIKKQGYSTTGEALDDKSKKKFATHLKKIQKVKADAKPNCLNCKQYRADSKNPGFGKCAMVGATGKPGKLVAESGWCRVWTINKKALS